MEPLYLDNNDLTVQFSPYGAELQSVKDKHGVEYIWQAEPDIWARHAPILFPIVGALKNHRYSYQENEYSLPQHGFARDRQFMMTKQTRNEVEFQLVSDEETLAYYPFEFEFRVKYSLVGNTLTQQFNVINTNKGELLFSVGGHPAFSLFSGLLDASGGVDHDNDRIEFDCPQNIDVLNLSSEGLASKPVFQLESVKEIPLTKEVFNNDALIILKHHANKVSLVSGSSGHQVEVDVSEFPHLGIWSKPGADFVCIEPWSGHADFVGHNGRLEDKAGVIQLSEQEHYQAQFSMTFKKD